MSTNALRFFAGLFLAACLSTAWSADRDDILFNQVHLQAAAEQNVENDLLEVTLAVEAQGKEPARVAAQVNETMTWALKRARAGSDIEVQTQAYQTYPVYRDQVVVAWRASQQLLLKSRAVTELTELAGVLQERLQIKRMQFSVSPEARRQAENALIGEAMEAFKQRVLTVREHMDESDYRIVNLNINTSQPSPVMYQERAMAMSARDAPAPAVEGGTSHVSVTVSGSVQFY